MVYIYLFISFIVLFLSVKKWGEKLKEEMAGYDPMFFIKEFWFIVMTTTLWFIVIPTIIAWKALDKLFNKFIK